MKENTPLTETERTIINGLQGGFPLCDRPYLEAAKQLGLSEEALLQGIRDLLDSGVLTRFGPLYHAERLGGALSLVAMQVPEQDFERVSAQVNAFPEVAHNYARDHALNMWFVIATEQPERKTVVLAEIEQSTGLPVRDMPKLAEYFVGLYLQV
jgi:DNA-binding Lrp family transcriptional regulator